MNRIVTIVLAVALVAGLAACGASNRDKGLAVGAATGAVVGGVIADDTAVGAIMGAVIGGAAGAFIGDYMDRQAEELAELEGATVERVGEGIKITFGSGLLFDVEKYDLTAEAQGNLGRLAAVLNKYEDTDILIEGHTDNTGTEEFNQKLSEQRAQAVSSWLAGQSVAGRRMETVGYGELQPDADNDTKAGRALNRRVEVAIYANEELKAAAEKKIEEGN